MADLDLAAMLCSRLCHDLIGPIGALNNGIEILADEEDAVMREEATKLLAASAVEAARRLRFYRIAFGIAGGLGQAISLTEVRQAAEGLFAAGKVRLDWPAEDSLGAGVPKLLAKLLANLILIGTTALPRGGLLTVRRGPARAALTVQASGAHTKMDVELRTALAGGLDNSLLDSHNAVAYYAAALAHELGGHLDVATPADGSIAVTFSAG